MYIFICLFYTLTNVIILEGEGRVQVSRWSFKRVTEAERQLEGVVELTDYCILHVKVFLYASCYCCWNWSKRKIWDNCLVMLGERIVIKISNSSYCHLDTYVTLVSLILRCSISFMSYTCELEKHYFFPLSLSPSLQPRNFNKIKHRNTSMILFLYVVVIKNNGLLLLIFFFQGST